jgi:PAS domain S-box-containing protein
MTWVPLDQRFRLFSRVASLAAIVTGCLVLLGWYLEVGLLTRSMPGWPSMQPNTALGFVLLGIGALLPVSPNEEAAFARVARRGVVAACAGLAALLGLATVLEYVFRVGFRVDELSFHGTGQPHGHMALTIAAGFVIFGTTTLLNGSKLRRWHVPAECLALSGLALVNVAIAAWVHAPILSGFTTLHTVMPVHTAVLFVLLGWGVVFSRPDRGLASIITAPGFGGQMVRQLLPVALLLPFVLDWLQASAGRAALFSVDVGQALFATTNALIFGACILLSGNLLKREEATRVQADVEQARLSAIVESSGDAIISQTLDGTIVSWNRGAERLFGYTAAEAINRSVTMLIPADRGEEESLIVGGLLRGERVGQFETVRRRKEGSLVDSSLTLSPIWNTEGRMVGASIIARDITDRKRVEQALRDRDVALEGNRLKSTFLANMSHELRSPLNAIVGFTDLMHRGKVGPVSAAQEEYLGDVLTSARHLLQLINDILDLAKVESGKMEFRYELVDLDKLAHEVRDALRSLAAQKQLQMNISVHPEMTTAVVDPGRVKQILYNFLSNAIKFTPERGSVDLRILPEGPALFRIDVQDTGIGISASDMNKLFVEFQQLDSGFAKTQQGTGLGLVLTKRIAEGHGGHVTVDSTPGEGSTFSAILPRGLQRTLSADDARPATRTVGSLS